ncbi:DUF72 domain-containing protein [Vagococcus xieshaowenii]|uniref:DUF72 domain-containing protein n=1 Tax=Vagococcus xieshaowenii TaxID=2562451 RepID=A0AAJ5EES6_9ENTE|nr:DUF72 domain-containing protein [Vagococcus xieshaowenii]QCA28043.1 DUF72 domain-containing protein [Vagococcus xieshaowenii]TFZ42101.1 DUF72 domain-containing protein [Vagococcus xieshaowenii]
MLLGMTSWSEHQALDPTKRQLTLNDYASKLPVVEIDTFFYGLKEASTVESWVKSTPDGFKFVVKTHQCMTQHRNWQDFFENEKELYDRFLTSLAPMINAGKLGCLLLQFPPFFDCTSEHIVYLKRLRKIFDGLPLAVEFRHDSWFEERLLPQTIRFMEEHFFSLVVVDEPQVKSASVPWVPAVTNNRFVLVRLHGRNQAGWLDKSEDWRKKRTLYDYSDSELVGIGQELYRLGRNTEQVMVIFNNNSGGHAAKNCLQLKELLSIEYEGLNPEQTQLF